MSRQAFSYCLSTSKRSGATINQVPLFGSIFGEAYIEEEEEEIGNDEADAKANDVNEEPKGPTTTIMEEPQETQQEIAEQPEEQVFEPVIEQVTEPIEYTDNVFEEILREEA